jgi:hypothetical protein
MKRLLTLSMVALFASQVSAQSTFKFDSGATTPTPTPAETPTTIKSSKSNSSDRAATGIATDKPVVGDGEGNGKVKTAPVRNPTVTQGLKTSRETSPGSTGPTNPTPPVAGPQPPEAESIHLNSSRSNVYREMTPPNSPPDASGNKSFFESRSNTNPRAPAQSSNLNSGRTQPDVTGPAGLAVSDEGAPSDKTGVKPKAASK